MAIDLRFDPEKNIVIVTVKGNITIDEFHEVMNKITRSDNFPPNINALWDLRDMDMRNIDSYFWNEIINIRKKFPERGNARLAHIVGRDFEYGMLRMYEIISENSKEHELRQDLKIFKNYSEGEKWLLS